MTKYAAIFTMLLRLRQTVDHPFLVMGTAASIGRGTYAMTAGRSTVSTGLAEGHKAKATAVSSAALPDADGDDDGLAGDGSAEALQALPPGLVAELYVQLVIRRQRISANTLVPSSLAQHAEIDCAAAQAPLLPQPSAAPVVLPDFMCSQLGSLAHEGVGGRECPVCMDELVVGATMILAACGHMLCDACFGRVSSSCCPVCRVPLSTADGAVRVGGRPGQALKIGLGGGGTLFATLDKRRIDETVSETTTVPISAPRAPPPSWHAAANHSGLRGDVVPRLPWRSSSKLDLLMSDLQAIAAHNLACDAKLRASRSESAAATMEVNMRDAACDDSEYEEEDASVSRRRLKRLRQDGMSPATSRRPRRFAEAVGEADPTIAGDSTSSVFVGPGPDEDDAAAAAAAPAGRPTEDREDLVAEIAGMLLTGRVKVVVFSFFTYMLDLVDVGLRACGIVSGSLRCITPLHSNYPRFLVFLTCHSSVRLALTGRCHGPKERLALRRSDPTH